MQLLYRTVLDFNVRIYRYLGPLKKVSVEISDLKRSKCLIKNVRYNFFEFELRKHTSAARSVAPIFAVTGFICRRGPSARGTSHARRGATPEGKGSWPLILRTNFVLL